MRIERIDNRQSGQFVHVEALPGVFTVVAAWMFDASACTGMEVGTPHASVAALVELMASAKVGSPMTSCQVSTESRLVTMVERRP